MSPPPLLGYNNNVRHRGRIFHIQTEDSGVGSPRIMTHLFADGGRIVKSTRTDYSEHLERADMPAVVKNMMKEQHKAMFTALRSGELDLLIGFSDEDPPGSSMKGNAAEREHAVGLMDSKSSNGTFAAEDPEGEMAVPLVSAAGAKRTSEDKKSERPSVTVKLPSDASEAKPYAASRPASIFTAPAPSSANIFGEVGIDEKSLDDAILSYLAEDEEAKPKKKDK